jgi:ribonuclease P protein component
MSDSQRSGESSNDPESFGAELSGAEISFRCKKLWSLRGPQDFLQVRRNGIKAVAGPIVLHAVRSEADHPLVVGMIVTKQVGNAVVRNRVRRHLREALRSVADDHRGSKVVVRVIPGDLALVRESLWVAVVSTLAKSQRSCGPKSRGTTADSLVQ